MSEGAFLSLCLSLSFGDKRFIFPMLGSGGLRSCTWTEYSSPVFTNSSLNPPGSAGAHCDLTLLTCLLIGSYRFCIIPLLARTQLWRISGGPAQSSVGRPGSSRTTAARPGHLVLPVRSTEPALSTGRRTTASTASQASSRSGAAPPKWSPSSRLARPMAALPVDKSRPKAQNPPRSQAQNQPAPQPPLGHGPTEQPPAEVLQRALAERDEAVKQRRELSEEMVTLRGELASSALCVERLEREREETCAATAEALRAAQERHGGELAQLEERLQAFYQDEWDKAHRACQEEADRCKALMDQQMEELRANHGALRLELEARHAQQLQEVREQYEGSLGELRGAHDQELQTLSRALEEAEATLSAQIQELTEENSALSQRLKAEEDRRRELAEKNQKDSHTLYLEQELDSLKVVLDIKNKQLHQQDKKLMQMDKLMEKSVKLDECLKRVQQENEDLRARMDRHSALSRQLSTEQAVLQETLQKESKVNKRLSMENEELLWKLHNGDLASPRKMSPVSPSHSLGLQSPRSPPVSPR